MQSKVIIPKQGEDPLKVLWRCDGYYRRVDGGPVVGYAGTYDPGDGGPELQFVGDHYCNFAMLEEHAPALWWVARQIADRARTRIDDLENVVFCGAPEGGKGLANQIASVLDGRWIFPEKTAVAEGTASGRAKSAFGWARHRPKPGDRVVLVEDVSNNMSTPDKLAPLVIDAGAEVVGMVTFLNRSFGDKAVEDTYRLKIGQEIPVVALVRKAMPQYRQNDPHVATEITKGNVEWKVKDNWKRVLPYIQEFVAP